MKKTILLTFFLLLGSMSLFAQDGDNQLADPNDRLVTIKSRFTDNFFVELHAGSYLSWGTNLRFAAFFRRFNPGGGVAVGKWLNPYVAPRLQFMYGQNKAQLLGPKRSYGFKSVAGTGDAVLSLSNIFFRYNPKRWIDVQGILGVGAEYTFGFDDYAWNVSQFYYNNSNKLHLSIHTGLGLKFRVSQAVDLGMEGVVTFSGNTFDGGYRGSGYDGHVNIMATLGYRFRNSTGSHLMTFKGRRYMTSYHHKRPKIRKIESEYISIVATDDRNRIQSYAYFAPDSASLDYEASKVVDEAVNQYRAHNSSVKIYLTVKDAVPSNLSLFLLRAGAIRDKMMKEYVVPAGSILIERNPEVVMTLDPEKVAVVVYIDDKPGSVRVSTTGVSATDVRPAVQTRQVLVEQPIDKKTAKAEKKLNEQKEKAEKKSRKEAEKAEKKSYKNAVKAQKKSLKEQVRQAKKQKKNK